MRNMYYSCDPYNARCSEHKLIKANKQAKCCQGGRCSLKSFLSDSWSTLRQKVQCETNL